MKSRERPSRDRCSSAPGSEDGFARLTPYEDRLSTVNPLLVPGRLIETIQWRARRSRSGGNVPACVPYKAEFRRSPLVRRSP